MVLDQTLDPRNVLRFKVFVVVGFFHSSIISSNVFCQKRMSVLDPTLINYSLDYLGLGNSLAQWNLLVMVNIK